MTTSRNWLSGWRPLGFIGLVALLIWLALVGLPDGRLHVYFLDVGEGDAIFIQTPDGRQVLVDGGPSATALLAQLGAVMPFWDRDLDLVVLSHPDDDHLGGLIGLLERYRVAHVLDSAQAAGTGSAAAWQALGQAEGITRTEAARGMRLEMGDVLLTVLHPAPAAGSGSPPASANDQSTVLRVDHGQVSILLTGDAGQAAEMEMIETGVPLRAQVLKAGHHGSDGATSPAFLEAVAPQVVVMQVGADNRYGHPHADVLSRIEDVPVFRTDLHGRIEIISDGRRLWVRTTDGQ